MIRTFAVAALAAAALATPALAADKPAADTASVSAFTAHLSAVATEKEIRQLLASQGYFATSDLNRDDAGRWIGTALKDGKVVRVGVKLPPRTAPTPFTN